MYGSALTRGRAGPREKTTPRETLKTGRARVRADSIGCPYLVCSRTCSCRILCCPHSSPENLAEGHLLKFGCGAKSHASCCKALYVHSALTNHSQWSKTLRRDTTRAWWPESPRTNEQTNNQGCRPTGRMNRQKQTRFFDACMADHNQTQIVYGPGHSIQLQWDRQTLGHCLVLEPRHNQILRPQ